MTGLVKKIRVTGDNGMIKVKVNALDYPDVWRLTPVMWECWVVGKLRDAGIPVKGFLVFGGVKRGVLSRFDDAKDFGGSTYVWKDEDEQQITN